MEKTRHNAGFRTEDLGKLSSLVTLNILSNPTVAAATVSLAGAGFAEKRGSMINVKGRLQRLNRAIQPPGEARDDWEVLRDLIQAISGSNGIYMIEDVFRQMTETTPALAGLSLSKVGDLGVQLTLE